ncbi:MAG: ABC transporter ATP-binding protein, partial [Candidatus Binatia bacterium]
DITMSFALNPELLFMDEPTSGVSIEDKFEVMDTLVKVLEESDITTIFVEHDMEVVQRYAKRVLVFHDGRIIADDTPKNVLDDPEVKRTVLGKV